MTVPMIRDAALAVALRRLASQQPQLQVHLEPLLAHHMERTATERLTFAHIRVAHPALTAERWSRATILEKYAVTRRLAHKPILLSDGLTIQKVREREAFMAYKVDQGANNSKFYEAIVLPSDDGTFRVKRRWGALTDSGQTGRIDGGKFDFDPRFSGLSLSQAKSVVMKVYKDRVDHGYTDAFGPDHVTPDGKKLPSGQYPVGLTRTVDFGWGTQSVAFCIPALRAVQTLLQGSQDSLRRGDPEAAAANQNLAEMQAKQVLKADSSMGQKILDNIQHMQGRAALILSGRAPDSEIGTWTVALSRLMSYLDKQLSLCNR